MVLVNNKEKSKLRPIEKIINKKFIETRVPSGKEICESQLMHLIDRVKNTVVNEGEIQEFLPSIYKKLEVRSRGELSFRYLS